MSDETGDRPPPEDQPTERLIPDDRSSAQVPARIGPYRILKKIGQGGMGIVYLAEQESPKRQVAVKVVRGGRFVDEAMVRMFQREADTLARLKHPNIAAIYESGRTEDGRHFFAMELVQGETLDAFMKKRAAETRRDQVRFRLALFRQIADAVHYAHQRGVIHRDLKPNNIIVTEQATRDSGSLSGSPTWSERLPEIKILDFGLARITEGDVAATTMATDVGVIKGTLPYMSPEQARGNPDEIDVRTDVYALGVMLYEMLSGQRPYDVTRVALVEAVRIICQEPPRPLPHSMPNSRSLDPDIVTIVFKALDKEADRRYASAAALSEDVARYLTSQPILARPPSTVYQLRKFAERNRALVGGIAATFVVLLAGVIASTVLGLREAAQRREAEQARDDLETVVTFQQDMLAGVEPDILGASLWSNLQARVENARRDGGATNEEIETALATFTELFRGVNPTSAALQLLDEEILDRAGRTIEVQLENQPRIAARLRGTIGNTYRQLGLYGNAAPYYSSAREGFRRALGDDHPDTLRLTGHLGSLLQDQGELEEAETYLREALEGRRRVLGDDHPDTLGSINNLGLLFYDQGELKEAETYYRAALEGFRRVVGDDDPRTLNTMSNLGVLLDSLGRLEEAESYSRAALEGRRRVLGDDHLETLRSINNLGVLLGEQGKQEEAEAYFREALEGRRRAVGDDHPETLNSIHNMCWALMGMGKQEEAESYCREGAEGRRRVLGDDHPHTLISINILATWLQNQGKLEEAEPYFREALDRRRRVLGGDHPGTLESINNLGYLLALRGRPEEAEPYYREVLESIRRVLGDDHPNTLMSLSNMAMLLLNQGKLNEAEPYLHEVLERCRRVLGEDHPHTLASMYRLGCLVAAKGEREEALDYLRRAVSLGWAEKDIVTNENLDSLRSDPEFEAIVAEVKGRLAEPE